MRNRATCPHCERELDIVQDWYDDCEDLPSVRIERAPLTDEPCSVFDVPVFIVGVGGRVVGMVYTPGACCDMGDGAKTHRFNNGRTHVEACREPRRRYGARCNWLGNERWHVFPCSRHADQLHVPTYYRGTETPCA